MVKPDIYIDLGDTGEWELFGNHHWKDLDRPPDHILIPMLDKSVKEVNDGMSQIDRSLDIAGCEIRHFVQGNHEVWLDKFVTNHPYLSQYRTKKALKLKAYYDSNPDVLPEKEEKKPTDNLTGVDKYILSNLDV